MTELFRANSIHYFVILQPAVHHSDAITSYPAAMSASPITTPADEVTLGGWFLDCAWDKYFAYEHTFWCFEFSESDSFAEIR